ncbi:hypothetical protein BDV96DRAFT_458280, partial [Lophiotrema nucula]
PNHPPPKSFSCVLCAQRKVKCDKRPRGCANCTKARVPCIYKAPPPPRRKKKGAQDIDTSTRLRLYEDALRKLGVDPADVEKEEIAKTSRKTATTATHNDEPRIPVAKEDRVRKQEGVLVTSAGKSVYLDNALWTGLTGEFRDSKEILEDSSDDEAFGDTPYTTPEAISSDVTNLLFASTRGTVNLRGLHPQPVQIFKLWQAYLDNINPLSKLFHTPSIQQLVLHATGNLDDLPRNLEALLFGIYCVSLSSLSEVECDTILGDPKDVLAAKFRSGAQHALVNASFLRSNDLMVLQAYVLFLLSLQNFDAKVLWILSGIAGRIGQRLGLHRDGEELGLPPFETEMRRRLWWQIMFVDGHSQKLAGTGATPLMGDTKRPLNVNDSQLFPDMKELPMEHEGATEMTFFLIRCHVGEFMKRSKSDVSFDGVWGTLSTQAVPLESKDKAIDELQSLFERKFLQYCDPAIAWHFMCQHLVKAVVCMMRFMAHNPTTVQDSMPQSEKDMLFKTALQVVSWQNLAYTMKEMQGFLWHINMHFQWKAFIYIVSELRYRTAAPEADDAWKQVGLVYEYHPRLSKELSKRALPVAVGNLTLKAWDAFIAARRTPGHGGPIFIQILRAQRKQTKPP